MRLCLTFLLCLFLVSLVSVASAVEEFVFQYGNDGYEDTMDTHITEYSGNSSNNMGGNIENECCEYDPANTDGKSVLVWFDVSEIPKDAVIGNATLELYMTTNRNGGNDKEVAAHRLLKDWAEGVGTGIDGVAAGKDEVCGQWTGKGEEWAKVGAEEPGVDWIEDAEDVIEIGGQIGEWYVWDVTEACQYWVKNPDENFGLILLEPRPHTNAIGTKVFASKENADASIHPMLAVEVSALSVDVAGKLATSWGGIRSDL